VTIAGTVATAVLLEPANLGLRKTPRKSKAASIKLTLAAVALDADDLLRP